MNNNDMRLQNFWGAIVFVICFIIACMFLYWAVEYYVYNNFDKNRYTISKLQVGNSDSLSVWKLDNRTGELQYCTKSYERMDHFVCVRSVVIDAKEETPTAAEPLKAVPSSSEVPQAASPATAPASETPSLKPVYSEPAKQ